MATIKVYSANGVKELKCFDILQNVDYLLPDQSAESSDEDDDIVDF